MLLTLKATDVTFNIDCDVIQADGGTRTAAITGAFVALKIAIDKLLVSGKLKENPLIDTVAAVSVGLRDDNLFVDLDYQEDLPSLDMNVVMTQAVRYLRFKGQLRRLLLLRIKLFKSLMLQQNH